MTINVFQEISGGQILMAFDKGRFRHIFRLRIKTEKELERTKIRDKRHIHWDQEPQ